MTVEGRQESKSILFVRFTLIPVLSHPTDTHWRPQTRPTRAEEPSALSTPTHSDSRNPSPAWHPTLPTLPLPLSSPLLPHDDHPTRPPSLATRDPLTVCPVTTHRPTTRTPRTSTRQMRAFTMKTLLLSYKLLPRLNPHLSHLDNMQTSLEGSHRMDEESHLWTPDQLLMSQ